MDIENKVLSLFQSDDSEMIELGIIIALTKLGHLWCLQNIPWNIMNFPDEPVPFRRDIFRELDKSMYVKESTGWAIFMCNTYMIYRRVEMMPSTIRPLKITKY